MKKSVIIFSMVLMLLGAFGYAGATTLTFDDVPGANSSDWNNPVPNGYGGLNWENMYVLHKSYYPGTGYDAGVVSGEWIAYNGYGTMAVTSSGSIFDFNGAYFTSAWYDQNVLTIKGYNDGVLMYTNQAALFTQGPQWVAANFTSVDRIEFSTSNYQFAMDNFTYNVSAVPEPATLLLLGLGLLGLAGLKRKK